MSKGQELKQLREHHGLLQKDVARKSGVHQTLVSLIENEWRQPVGTQEIKIRTAITSLVMEKDK